MKIVTWNMQGATGSGEDKWRYVKNFLSPYTPEPINADVVCLQECGPQKLDLNRLPGDDRYRNLTQTWPMGFEPPNGCEKFYFEWTSGTDRTALTLYMIWIQTDPNGNRCNMAIVSN